MGEQRLILIEHWFCRGEPWRGNHVLKPTEVQSMALFSLDLLMFSIWWGKKTEEYLGFNENQANRKQIQQ